MATAFRYSKPILSRKKFIEESGYPAAMVDRALHGELAGLISVRSSDAKNAKVSIIADEFEYYRRQGDIR